jgi:hypothetical protein
MVENPKEVQPYYDNAYDWVDSLDYSNWICDPFMSPYGISPFEVYSRLFDEQFYYILTPEELKILRTTIQYKATYLNGYFQKCLEFLKSIGFEVYRTHKFPNSELKSVYLRRDNISLYISNQFVPQDFVPNTIELGISKYVTNKLTGKRRSKSIDPLLKFPVIDELGEKTKQSFEKYLSKIIK